MRLSALPTLAVLLAGLVAAAAPARACPGADHPCRVALGEYFVRLPAQAVRAPLVVFLHGAGGRAEAAVAGAGFAATLLDRGYAVLAPQGLAREAGGNANWAVRDGRLHPRDDVAFVAAVIDDAATRFGLDRERVLLAGFSRGGSLVWDIACHRPALAAAYAPVAGGFWRPHPDACRAPVQLLHTHGFVDPTVPLEGRELRGGAVVQGDIHEGLQLWRRTNGCAPAADRHDTTGAFWRKAWTTCAAGSLALALHPGGHGVPAGWAELALGWFEERVPAMP